MDPPRDASASPDCGAVPAGWDRSRGRHPGRPSALSDDHRSAAIAAVIHAGKALASVATRFRVHTRTIRRILDDYMAETNGR